MRWSLLTLCQDDIVKALEHFRTLRTLAISNLLRQLSRPAGEMEFLDGYEAKVLWYASRMVQAVSDLKELHIDERGLGDEKLALKGRLEVKSNRELVGTLERIFDL